MKDCLEGSLIMLFCILSSKYHLCDESPSYESEFPRELFHTWYECDVDCAENANVLCFDYSDCSDAFYFYNEFCNDVVCLKPGYFQCADFTCVNYTKECNRQEDCPGGSDELNCKTWLWDTKCDSSRFLCDNQACIPKKWTCDGIDDCGDNSDETLRCSKKCKETEFQCLNNECIPMSQHCNHFYDCADRSDENHCGRYTNIVDCTPHNDKFLCKDGLKCIQSVEVCDQHVNCFDGSDEGELCNQTDKHCKYCTHHCLLAKEKTVCLCPFGFFVNDKNQCQDINECDEYAMCDQKCLNSNGSYQCACNYPYTLQSDNKTCKINGGDAMLLYSASTGIKGIHLQSHQNFSVINFQNNVSSFPLTAVGTNVYWVSNHPDPGTMYKTNLVDNSTNELVNSGIGIIQDLDIDWITGNIYYCDTEFRRIVVCSHDGLDCTDLHDEYVHFPYSLSLAPQQGLLFWSNIRLKNSIYKSAMDGSDIKEIFSHHSYLPHGLSTDSLNGRLYWVAGLHRICSIKFDGTDARIIKEFSIYKIPEFISVYENKLYWNFVAGKEVWQSDKFTGENEMRLIHDNSSNVIFKVHVVYPIQLREKIENPCANNSCSDMCLIAPGSENRLNYSCACPIEKQLSQDKKTCRNKTGTQFFIAAAENNVYVIDNKHLGRLRVTKKVKLDIPYEISSLAYDYLQGRLIFTCYYESASIYSYDLHNGNKTTLLTSMNEFVQSIQYDDHGNNLYWCSYRSHSIEVMNLKTLSRIVILTGTSSDLPMEIALVPSEGYMFVAFLENNESRIDRLSMDGNVTSLSSFLKDNSMKAFLKIYFDMETRRLFWFSSSTDYIQSISHHGIKRIIHDRTSNPFSIMMVNEKLFWTTKSSSYIYWKNNYMSKATGRLKFDDKEYYKVLLINPQNNDKFNSSPCLNNNGGCGYICLVSSESSKKYICGCPVNYTLAKDGFTCESLYLKKYDQSTEISKQSCPEGDKDCHENNSTLNLNETSLFKAQERIESESSLGTAFVYFVIICVIGLVSVLGFYRYRRIVADNKKIKFSFSAPFFKFEPRRDVELLSRE